MTGTGEGDGADGAPDEVRQLRHDLKTPLTAIIGFLELLEDLPAVDRDPDAARYVARCTSSAQRMLAMIDERLSAGD